MCCRELRGKLERFKAGRERMRQEEQRSGSEVAGVESGEFQERCIM